MSPATLPPPAPPSAEPKGAKPARGRQGLYCVWHGMNHATWRRLRRWIGGFPARNRLRRISISAAAWSNSFWEFWEEALYGRRVDQTHITQPPLFVLGHWRSGTTLLHQLLTLDPQFTYPNLYQVMFAGHCLLTERFVSPLTSWAIPKTRPMDNIPVGWKMPQEDEVALQLRTLLSPYCMLAFQGERAAYDRFFDLTELTPDELALWKREFLRLMKKVTLRSPKAIVLKSPSHTYRIPLLLELFPDAKFVYIHRDPYAVINSSMHLRRTIFTDNALGEPNFENLEEDTLLTYERCIQRYEATKPLIPAGQLHELRFDELEADPVGQMRDVYATLGLAGWPAVEPVLQGQLSAHANYRKNRFSMDEALMRRIYDRLKFAFDLYGYDSRLDENAAPAA